MMDKNKEIVKLLEKASYHNAAEGRDYFRERRQYEDCILKVRELVSGLSQEERKTIANSLDNCYLVDVEFVLGLK